MQDAVREMEQTLGEADLADVAKAAREAGDRALNKDLFRPADGWGRFTRACDQSPPGRRPGIPVRRSWSTRE